MWAYSLSWSIETLQILNLIGLFAFNLLTITIFSLPSVLFFSIEIRKKILILVCFLTAVLALYIFGSYELNKNKDYLKTINEKIYVKIISPNFELKYGLNLRSN